jgi:predicted RNA-binding Zn-ribbon protein involved in translation (DUF1610 family)
MPRNPEHTAALAIQLHEHLRGCTVCVMPIDPKAWHGVVLCPLISDWLNLHFPEVARARVHEGTTALTRGIWWCECGRGLAKDGIWNFCPRCGKRLILPKATDGDSSQTEISRSRRVGA